MSLYPLLLFLNARLVNNAFVLLLVRSHLFLLQSLVQAIDVVPELIVCHHEGVHLASILNAIRIVIVLGWSFYQEISVH